MCGIVGYVGEKKASPILLNCLKKLEYRGYDSCGIAIDNGSMVVYKDALRVEALAKTLPRLAGKIGIGHTRWATHGGPSKINAHPHVDCSGNIAVVHNGIITNYSELRRELSKEGHKFTSETDTEVIPHLVERYYKGNLEAAVEKALKKVAGSYAIAVIHAGDAKIVVAKKDSPLVIGIGDGENYVASDVSAFLDFTDRAVYLDDGQIAVITKDSLEIASGGKKVVVKEDKILWSAEEAQKSGYEHFMLKEIHEQPKVIRNTLAEYMRVSDESHEVKLTGNGQILMLACGTSYHAALVGKYIFEELLSVPVRVEIASEFNLQKYILGKTMAIAITQSGETADTLKAMKRVKGEGGRVVAITNVVGSTSTRIANQTTFTRAGPEISVAATKTFTAQLMVLYWLAISQMKDDMRRRAGLLSELRSLPSKVQQVLDDETTIKKHAKYLSKFENVFFIGRGVNFPVALEGALKLKEVSYIHAEGYAAGEIKHGPFALLGSETPVIAIVSRDNTYESMLTSIKEIKARKSPVIAVSESEDHAVEDLADLLITVPHVDSILAPVINTLSLQLLAYYTAREKGCPIDFPRNLAKSVTVE
jgi:glutamine---fructose-6-phosphate transaminase (isomerizing)